MFKNLFENYLKDTKITLDKISVNNLHKIIDILYTAYKNENYIFILGNGGSASTASHFACDLSKSTLKYNALNKKVKRFRALSLTDNKAIISAWANDINYDRIFVEQLKNLMNINDVVIAISASGNSPNVVNAVKLAKKNKVKTISLTGFSGGILAKIADVNITININKYDITEDIHLMLCHIIARYFYEKVNRK